MGNFWINSPDNHHIFFLNPRSHFQRNVWKISWKQLRRNPDFQNFRIIFRGIPGRILEENYPKDIGTSGASLFKFGSRDAPVYRHPRFRRIIEAYLQIVGKLCPWTILARIHGEFFGRISGEIQNILTIFGGIVGWIPTNQERRHLWNHRNL